MINILKVLIPILLLTSCLKDDALVEELPSNTLSGVISETVTLKRGEEYILKGYVYVPAGVSLLIEPGVVIKSDIAEKGALCIERGGKIYAEGTPEEPIVFTSGKSSQERAPGDWGGIVILGNAPTNRGGDAIIEGGIGRPYGGNDLRDNSGVLKYVRIEYAGIAAVPNSEINALTLGAVGSGTTISHIQSIYANDDAFEFFGGTVNADHLYAYRTADDDFDFDFGYVGKITNGVSNRAPFFVDAGDAGNGVECDNDGVSSTSTPTTHPKLDQMFLVGPGSPDALPNHNFGMRFRRGSNFTVTNSTIWGYIKGGVSIESDITINSFISKQSTISNTTFGLYGNSPSYLSDNYNLLTPEIVSSIFNQSSVQVTREIGGRDLIEWPEWIKESWIREPIY